MQATQAFRLSPQQRHLWELAQASPDQCCQCALLIEGTLDRQLMRDVIRKIIARHEVLRTTFYRQPGLKVSLQVINEAGAPSWKEVDLRSVDSRRASERLESMLLNQRQTKIAGQSGSLLDVLLVCLEPSRHVLSLALPSACCDTATFANLTREIFPGRAASNPSTGAEEATQYLQFSEWQNDLLEEEEGKSGLDYWHTLYGGNAPRLELPFDIAQPEGTQGVAHTELKLTGQSLDSIEIATAQCGASMNVFLAACWSTLLWRLSCEAEVRIGYISDGRKFKELEGALGLFATTIPIQLHLEAGSTFSEVVRRFDHRLNEALQWQEYFLLSDVAGRAEEGWPATFEYAVWPLPYENEAVRVTLHGHRAQAEPCVLKLLCSRDLAELTVELAYDSSRIKKEFAENTLEQFRTLLEGAAQAPHLGIEELPFLSRQDQNLIDGLRNTGKTWADNQDLVEMFEARAAETPYANVVISEENVLTYAELSERAGRLSWYLRSAGVEPEARVVLLLPRSELMVVGLLGVLKAGGAYVPVEPATPRARLRYLMDEVEASFVVTVAALLPLLDDVTATVVVLDRDEQAIAACAKVTLPQVLPQNLAYILFTSGSTGKPKGVAVERSQLQNYVRGVMERLRFAPGSQLAMVSSFAADLGNTVLFPAICGGGCLHLISTEKATDAQALATHFQGNQIEHLKIVPSHFSALLSASEHEQGVVPKDVLVFGGEALPWSLVDRVLEVAPGRRILNHYGPTETTVGVMTFEVAGTEDLRWGATVPLGRPLPNLQLYILDKLQRPAPMGVPGELYIGGSGVCRGYWNRAALTAERFLPDPWSASPGVRMYRTGDRVRLLPDGTMEFLDRLDRQIKLRGFRVELGEIEAVILDYPGVRQAAVELLSTASGEPQLVAFVGAGKEHKITSDQLRAAMRSILQEYMVPTVFAIRDSLPLTANGKIDRQVLHSFEKFEREQPGFVSPREMGEELLAGLWREVLGVSRVGVKDNFFELGGDSLIATKLISRVRKFFGIELPVRIVFEAPTVAQMALHIDHALARDSQLPALPPIVPVDRNGEVVLSFGQERLWGIHQLEPLSCAYNSTSAIRLSGPLQEDALAWALNEIVRRHEVLRTTFTSIDGQPRQEIHRPVNMELPKVSLLGLQGEELETKIKRLINEHNEQPFDLKQGPVLRLKLLNIDQATNILLISMHHIASDGWSQNVFMRELTLLYESYLHNRPAALPDLTIQYADFAAWQRQWLRGQRLEELLAYWKGHLAGAPETLNFPTDFSRPQQASYQGSCVVWQHSPEQVAQLKQLSRDEGVTLFMTLLTTYYVFLHYYTGQDDIVIGTDIANRNRLETENLIGFFINNLALRVNLSGSPTFRNLLDRVRTAALGAYAHQDLPFATLVKALRPKRSLSHTPIFQTLFVLQNNPMDETAPGTLQATSINPDMTTSKFDLALLLAESSEGLTAYWTYRSELFRAETIVEIGKDFNRILANILRHLDSPLSTLFQSEGNQRHGKTIRLSSKTIHANQETFDPALRDRTHSG